MYWNINNNIIFQFSSFPRNINDKFSKNAISIIFSLFWSHFAHFWPGWDFSKKSVLTIIFFLILGRYYRVNSKKNWRGFWEKLVTDGLTDRLTGWKDLIGSFRLAMRVQKGLHIFLHWVISNVSLRRNMLKLESYTSTVNRNSHPEVFCIISLNFAKFTVKHLKTPTSESYF